MRTQNYGDWKGDRPGGHHPPTCTCYRCNEEKRQLEPAKEEERRVAEYDKRVAEGQAQAEAQARAETQGRGDERARAARPQPQGQDRQPTGHNPSDRNRSRAKPPRRPPRTPSGAGQRGQRPHRGRSRLAILLWVAFLVAVVGVAAGAFYESDSGLLTLPQDDKPVALVVSVETPTPEPTSTQAPTAALTRVVLQRTPPLPSAPASAPALLPVTTPRPTLAPRPAPTLGPSREEELAGAKKLMLDLINEERVKAGVLQVEMGDNQAAQIHAENSHAGCFSSHWGLDGTKPYMRYTLAGGYQSNAENVSGHSLCTRDSHGYAPNWALDREVRDTVDGFMDSPGHRDNILYPTHRKVNLGIAWDRYNIKVVQHFEGDYVEFERLPTLENGVSRFKGSLRNGATLVPGSETKDLGVQVFYDPPLQELTRGQLARVYSYGYDASVASVTPPARYGYEYESSSFTECISDSLDPLDFPPDEAAPRTPEESSRMHDAAVSAAAKAESSPCTLVRLPWIDASHWAVSKTRFDVRANLGSVLKKHGPGSYTVVLWANVSGESEVVSEYPIFHETEPPDGYNP